MASPPDIWSELNDDKGGRPLVNRVVGGRVHVCIHHQAPLSSFAGMEYGVYTSRDPVRLQGLVDRPGRGKRQVVLAAQRAHGVRGLQDGIRDSCDAVFYDLGKNFFYADHDTEGLQGDVPSLGPGFQDGRRSARRGVGRVPDAEWKESYFKDWSAEGACMECRRYDQHRHRPG